MLVTGIHTIHLDKDILQTSESKLFLECVFPENIQTPTTEGIGNSGGVGGSKA